MIINEPASFRNSSPSLGAPALVEAVNFVDTSRFIAASAGTGDFIVMSPVAGFKTPEQAFAIDGKSYHYFAQFNEQWEEGYGVYDWATDKLFRTKIFNNSLYTKAKMNFSARPIVDVFTSPPLNLETGDIQPGSRMVFWNATAPLGWTKIVTHNDKALRVVSGTGGGDGGSVPFSTVFGKTATDSFTLLTTHLAAHVHSEFSSVVVSWSSGPGYFGGDLYANVQYGTNTGSQGGNTPHAHGLDIRVHYLDCIICEKG